MVFVALELVLLRDALRGTANFSGLLGPRRRQNGSGPQSWFERHLQPETDPEQSPKRIVQAFLKTQNGIPPQSLVQVVYQAPPPQLLTLTGASSKTSTKAKRLVELVLFIDLGNFSRPYAHCLGNPTRKRWILLPVTRLRFGL